MDIYMNYFKLTRYKISSFKNLYSQIRDKLKTNKAGYERDKKGGKLKSKYF